MHAVHAGYTVIARLKEGYAERVSQMLVDFNAHPEKLPFDASATTHFATCSVLPAEPYGDEELPACLMIATSFSGPSREHEDDLVATAGRGLREVLQYCEGFPDDCSDAELRRFLREHRQSDTFYSGMHNLTRADVVRHVELRNAIETFVDDRQHAGGLTGDASAVRREIQEFVRSRRDLYWAQESCEPDPGSWLALHWRSVVVLSVGLAYLLALVACSVALVWVHATAFKVGVACGWLVVDAALLTLFCLVRGVRIAEAHQTYVAERQPDEDVSALDATQCHPVINEMTVVGAIKEGRVRPVVLRLALWIVARVAEGIPGLTGGITIPTVATARWIAIDRGKRLVFISNFTNASEPYVRDFIDLRYGAMRINLTFGFGRGYPKTEWIIWRGALEDPNAFINVVHANQLQTELWYCPYKDMSIDNIRRNQAIREGLFDPAMDAAPNKWLQLL
jgi:hypothetical protein